MVSVAGNLPFCTHRYTLFVSYLGTKYVGSQRLIHRDEDGDQGTVQDALEWSLEGVFPKKRCKLTSCSRTDKGVHALMNCFTLPLMDFKIPTEQIKHTANRRLLRGSHDILVNQVILAPATFHPRKAALGREYIYRLAVQKTLVRSQKLASKLCPQELMSMLPVTELYRVLPLLKLDLDRARDVIDLLQGEHDFEAFALKPETGNTVREVEIDLVERNSEADSWSSAIPYDLYELHVKSRAFMRNQVRRMVGAIISYASYRTTSLETIRRLLEGGSESKNWPSELVLAEPYGLYLSKINYHRSSFEGSMRTDENGVQENCLEFPRELGISDNAEDLARLCLRTFSSS